MQTNLENGTHIHLRALGALLRRLIEQGKDKEAEYYFHQDLELFNLLIEKLKNYKK